LGDPTFMSLQKFVFVENAQAVKSPRTFSNVAQRRATPSVSDRIVAALLQFGFFWRNTFADNFLAYLSYKSSPRRPKLLDFAIADC
jgi:hypothetical protein